MKISENIQKILHILSLFFFIYLFLIGIKLIGVAFKLGTGTKAVELMNQVTNPFVGLFIGILATSLVQSSSSTTSLTVTLVAAGTLNMDLAIYIVMGANIGTSITNVLVSLSHITRRNEFLHAFAAATVHDFFNLIAVLVLFPLEYYFKYLSKASLLFTGILKNVGGLKLLKPLSYIVDPIVNLLKLLCGKHPLVVGFVAIALLFIALRYIVVVMKKLVMDKIKHIFGVVFFRNYISAMTSGVVITSVVQSSSVTTSLAVPFAAAKILTLEQIFPYTLGANIGTTVTALIASLSLGSPLGLQVALAHLIFNVTGIIFITPFKKVPIYFAKLLAYYSMKNRLIPFFYIIIQFFIIPLLIIYFGR